MCAIGLESTGIYSTNITTFLFEQNHKVMMITPILTNMTRKASKVHSPKNDNLDSQTICKYLADNKDSFTPCTSTLYHNQVLKSLSRKRYFIAKDLRKKKLSVNNPVRLIFAELKGNTDLRFFSQKKAINPSFFREKQVCSVCAQNKSAPEDFRPSGASFISHTVFRL